MNKTKLEQIFAEYIFDDNVVSLKDIVNNVDQLQLHKNTIYGNLIDSLKDIYPIISQLVGERFFKFLAKSYIKEYKPSSGYLDDYGSNLAEYLLVLKEVSRFPYFSHIAKLEWSMHKAYFVKDVTKFDLNKFSSYAPNEFEELKVVFHPSVNIVTSEFPIYDIWVVHQDSQRAKLVDFSKGGDSVVVFRKNDKVEVQRINYDEYRFYEYLFSGANLFEAFTVAASISPEFDLLEILKKGILNEIIVDIYK